MMGNIWKYFGFNRLYNYAGMLGGLLAGALGGWDVPVKLLVSAMALDYFSGVVVAVKEKKLSSAVGFHGLARKLMVFLIIMAAAGLDRLTGQTDACRSAAILFYFVNESVSLMENAARLGLPLPSKLTDILAQLKN